LPTTDHQLVTPSGPTKNPDTGRCSAVLLYSALQYYFLTVFIEIISLPGVTVFAGPITIGVG
jgi:hypothetical protein